MSKPTKNLKKRLKAPRVLVEATKKGEHFVPAHRADTRDVHIRRFAKAIAVYACAAVLLIAGVAILPSLWKGNAPITAQSGTVSTSDFRQEYVAPIEVEAKNYIRPDLIWASDLNPGLKDFVIWIAEPGEDGMQVVQSASFPDVGIENARYAVDVKLEYLESDGDDANQISQQRMKRDLAKLTGALQSVGIEPLKNQYGYDLGYRGNFANDPGNNYLLKYFEIGADQLTEEDERAILSNYETGSSDFRIEIKIAWQPCELDYESNYTVIWSAEAENGETMVTQPFTIPSAGGEDVAYTVEFCYEITNDWENLSASTVKRNAAQMQDVILNAGGESVGAQSFTLNVYTMDRDDLNAVDTDELLSLLGNVGDGVRITLRIAAQ